jgi:hypothetical protein
VVVHHQAEFIEAAVKTLHMTKEDEKWIDPAASPVMYDTWHMLYVYFIAVGKGDLKPLLDFMIDGRESLSFLKKHPHRFGPRFPDREHFPPKNLYLY